MGKMLIIVPPIFSLDEAFLIPELHVPFYFSYVYGIKSTSFKNKNISL